ncbi:hypothetical protein PEBR_30857 [Penicillium brasilianum]|uniref:Retrotransposon gag domain-containing protein n=1 Tax=Penicillium brasilianum TaxID=104259 RepID=A0A1S9RI61_PENBI|nr:hypothetical protein PEBR_30857 [Penicillium brasilianum]
MDFEILSNKLKERFPFRKREVDQMDTINKVMALKKGTKTFEAYCEEAIALKPLLGSDLESMLAQRWANGLRSEAAAAAIAMQQASWAEADRQLPTGAARNLNINRTIDYASSIWAPLSPSQLHQVRIPTRSSQLSATWSFHTTNPLSGSTRSYDAVHHTAKGLKACEIIEIQYQRHQAWDRQDISRSKSKIWHTPN